MLGLPSDICDHLVGEADSALSIDGRDAPVCCRIEDCFLRNTFLEVLGFNSDVGWLLCVGDLTGGPTKPNLCLLDCESPAVLVVGDGDRMLGLGKPVWDRDGCDKGYPLFGSVCPPIPDVSIFLALCFSNVGCQYVLILLSLLTSPERVGASREEL